MSKDGNYFVDFHNKCDNKGITISFIKTKKGFIFGWYTELNWDKYSGEKANKSTFLFSFNYKEKYNEINNNYSI